MNLNIRQATTKDADVICLLLTEGGKFHAHALPTLLKPPEISTTEKFVNNLLQDQESYLWVAEIDQQVVGYLHFNYCDEKEHPVVVPRSYISVSSLIVSEQFRHQGIGKALMQRVHGWATKHNVTDIELQVYEFNAPATSFYEKLGYQTVSRRMKRSN